jgi:sec-independent protein translocase protein TatA
LGNLGVPELLIIAGVIILLFGARKLPEMARSLGKSAKAFKEETKGLRGEDGSPEKPVEAAPTVVPQQLPEAQPKVEANLADQNAALAAELAETKRKLAEEQQQKNAS